MRETRTPKFVQIGCKGASGQIREIQGLFFFLFNFFPGLVYWSDTSSDFDAQWFKLRGITHARMCLFGVCTMAHHI